MKRIRNTYRRIVQASIAIVVYCAKIARDHSAFKFDTSQVFGTLLPETNYDYLSAI